MLPTRLATCAKRSAAKWRRTRTPAIYLAASLYLRGRQDCRTPTPALKNCAQMQSRRLTSAMKRLPRCVSASSGEDIFACCASASSAPACIFVLTPVAGRPFPTSWSDRSTASHHCAPKREVEPKNLHFSRETDHRLPILSLARCGGWRPKTLEMPSSFHSAPFRDVARCHAT